MKLCTYFHAAAFSLLFILPINAIGDTQDNTNYKDLIKDLERYIIWVASNASQPGSSDCSGSDGATDVNSGNGDDPDCPCPKDPCSGPPSCISEQISLAFVPNEFALGAARLQYYANSTNANLGGRQMLGIYGIPYMEATATSVGNATQYKIMQAGGSPITFQIDDDLSGGGSGYIAGLPTGGGAYSLSLIHI